MPKPDTQKILSEYDSVKSNYENFLKKTTQVLVDLIHQSDIVVHAIHGRLKTKKSLENKISQSIGKYQKLNDVTDICGIRIITYFEDDVNLVGQVIKHNFEIDEENSIDKKSNIEPDRFGYLSLHFIIEYDQKRLALPENTSFKTIKAEIQVRSILQHAWAEIEHDLGYKAEKEVPKNIRRKFAQIAGLLELADEQFNSIKRSLDKYYEEVDKKITENEFDELPIDKITVKKYLTESKLIRGLDERIKEETDGDLKFYESSLENYSSLGVNLINYFGFKTISEVDSTISEHSDKIVKYASEWLNHEKPILYYGISLFYFGYFWAASKENDEYLANYLQTLNIGGANSLVPDIKKTYQKVMDR